MENSEEILKDSQNNIKWIRTPRRKKSTRYLCKEIVAENFKHQDRDQPNLCKYDKHDKLKQAYNQATT